MSSDQTARRSDWSQGNSGVRLHRISRHEWARVVVQSLRDLYASNAFEWSAALSFYALLSLFPLLLLLLGMVLASYVVDASWATSRATELLGEFLPRGEFEIEAIVTAALAERRRTGVISLVVFLIAARRVLGALTKALNLVSDVDEQSDPIRRRIGVEIALLLGIVCIVLLALAAHPLGDLVRDGLQIIPGPDGLPLAIVNALTRVTLLLVAFILLYYFVPRGERLWRPAFTGAAAATILFLVAQAVYAVVIDPLWSNLNLVYGPLAIAALLMTWGWYVALITLAGAALASHVKVMILENRSGHEAQHQHVP